MRVDAFTNCLPERKNLPFREIDLTYLALGVIYGLTLALLAAAFLMPSFTAKTAALMGAGAVGGGLLSLVIQKITFHYLHPTKKFREVPLPRFKSPTKEEIEPILQEFEGKDWYLAWQRVRVEDHLKFLVKELKGGSCFGICAILALHLDESKTLTSQEALNGFFTKYRQEIVRRQLLEVITADLSTFQADSHFQTASREQYQGLKKEKGNAGIVIFDNGKMGHVLFYEGKRMLDVWNENTGFYQFDDFEAGLRRHLDSYGKLENEEYWSPG